MIYDSNLQKRWQARYRVADVATVNPGHVGDMCQAAPSRRHALLRTAREICQRENFTPIVPRRVQQPVTERSRARATPFSQ